MGHANILNSSLMQLAYIYFIFLFVQDSPKKSVKINNSDVVFCVSDIT